MQIYRVVHTTVLSYNSVISAVKEKYQKMKMSGSKSITFAVHSIIALFHKMRMDLFFYIIFFCHSV